MAVKANMNDDTTVSIRQQDDLIIATVQVSELTTDIADSLQAVGQSPHVKLILDVAKVKFINSVALGSLVVLLRRVKQNKGRLALVGLGGHCRNVMEVTGLHRVFELHDTLESAVRTMNEPLS